MKRDKEFIRAVETGDVNKTRMLLPHINVNMEDIVENNDTQHRNVETIGYTPLMYAIFKGHFEIVQILLSAGADINKPLSYYDAYGNLTQPVDDSSYLYDVPIYFAALNKHEHIVKLLMKHGAKVDFRDNDGYTMFITLCSHGISGPIVKLFTKHGIDVNQKNSKNGYTALYKAAINGHSDTVKALVQDGAQVNYSMSEKVLQTPLEAAIREATINKVMKTVDILLKHGADVDFHVSSGWTHLMACVSDLDVYIPLLKRIVSETKKINSKDKDGKTALEHAFDTAYDYEQMRKCMPIFRLLIENGATLPRKSKYYDLYIQIQQTYQRKHIATLASLTMQEIPDDIARKISIMAHGKTLRSKKKTSASTSTKSDGSLGLHALKI
jgi:ankyrin repeat protein